MGYGEVIGNGSVHWKIDHEKGGKKLKVNDGVKDRPTGDDEVNTDTQALGRDPVAVASIGKGSKKGYFNVRLRFDSGADAVAEAQRAGQNVIDDGKGSFFLALNVRAIQRTLPDDSPAPEVRVDW